MTLNKVAFVPFGPINATCIFYDFFIDITFCILYLQLYCEIEQKIFMYYKLRDYEVI